MKNIYMMLLACLCCLWACQDENRVVDEPVGVEGGNYLTLTLKSAVHSPGTKADPEAGIDDYNENLLQTANVYFFEDTGQPYVFGLEGLTVGSDNKLKVKIDQEMYGKRYTIYVIANAGSGYSTQEETLAALQAKKITTEWKDGLTADASVTEEALLMHGLGQNITVEKGGSATIELKRAMAKVVLTPTVDESIEIDGVTYEPDLTAMHVTFVNSVKATQLDGKYIPATDDYITVMKRNYTDGTHVPFYSYPNPADNEGRLESYLILCVPWRATQSGGSTSFTDYYYYVPITGGVTTLEANCYYKVAVQVGILGSLDPNEPVELETVDFEVIDWYSMEIDADIKQYQFLVLDDYTSVLYN